MASLCTPWMCKDSCAVISFVDDPLVVDDDSDLMTRTRTVSSWFGAALLVNALRHSFCYLV
jgi:hypothetical protein